MWSVFFFKQKTAYEMRISDWSSDVCSADLPQVMIDIINVSSGRNSAIQDKFPKAVLPGTFDFGFTTALSYKDVRLCVEEAEAMGVPMLGGALVRQVLAITKAKYGPESDFTCIAKVIEEWAGVEIRSTNGGQIGRAHV